MEPIKSTPSRDIAFVSFINNTPRRVEILWYNFEGKFVRYGILPKGGQKNIDTFSGHPWACFDYNTTARLSLNGNPVYYPLSVREIHQRVQRGQMRTSRCGRLQVHVTIPMFMLKELCSESILRHVRKEEEVDQLEIPKQLQVKLKNQINSKKDHLRSVLLS